MSTLEDMFYLYERNSRYYYDCVQQNKIENCEDCWSDDCFCYLKQTVLPFTIGNQNLRCSMKTKCYIRPFEECPICYDKIITKSSAFITECGHAFHKKCLFKYMEIKWLASSYLTTLKCPICRGCLGHPKFINRYNATNYISRNGLDKLEDFWLSYEYKVPVYCSNKYDHYLGMKKNCRCCRSYIANGDLLYYS
jgi:hypothetical protein